MPYITRFKIITAGIKVAAKSRISFLVPKFVFKIAAIIIYESINLTTGHLSIALNVNRLQKICMN
jgi:hypothetical protein